MRENLYFFFKIPCFQNFTLLVASDIFFSLRPVEEGEGEDGDGCCASDIQEFDYRGMSLFVMGSSRKVSLHDEASLSGRVGKALVFAWSVRLVFDQIGPGWSWGSTPLFYYNV